MRLVGVRSLPMIGCHAARSRLSELLEPHPHLDASEERFMRLHLARCHRCRRLLASLTSVVEHLGGLRRVEVERAGIAERIHRQIRRDTPP